MDFKQKIISLSKKIFLPSNVAQYQFILPKSENVRKESLEEAYKMTGISTNIYENLDYIKVKYNALINSDIVIREFYINAYDRKYKSFLIFIDGMVDAKSINNYILKPLMLKNTSNTEKQKRNKVSCDVANYIASCLLPQNDVEQQEKFEDIIDDINAGNCVLFVDTLNIGFDIDVKGFKQRSIDTPNNEIVIRGSQESFNEVLRTNTSLIRRIINNENLVIENIKVGKVSKTKCAVCYIKNIANNELVSEVKFRLNNLNIDYLISSGQLEQLIEDNGKFSLPQLIATERPDKAAYGLLDGRVVIIVNGSPYALIAPGVFVDFLASPEDRNLKYQFANMLKILRILAYVITLLLPGMYIAITSFHQELIPTELLFTIIASRESVPMPIFFEILVMEISFELIREAGLRVPSAIGSTIGIVGALILGQAAVDANLVSPILIIIVAVTGLASFTIPDFSLSFHCRVFRFGFIILGYIAGFIGIAMGIMIYLLILCSIKSFGVSYLEPYIPSNRNINKAIFLSPAWKRENRDSFVNAKRKEKQGKISMKWKYNDGRISKNE